MRNLRDRRMRQTVGGVQRSCHDRILTAYSSEDQASRKPQQSIAAASQANCRGQAALWDAPLICFEPFLPA
ncbi:MAG: hypothetical protein ACKO3T_12895 [Planctomycetaceae bacterium]